MSFIILSIGFVVLLRVLFSFSHSTDEWYTMWRIVYQKGKKYNYDTPRSIIKGFSGSPKFYYYLLSLIPARFLKAIGVALNIVFDVLSSFLLALYLYHQDVSLFKIGLAILVFGTAPILMPINARLKGLKARTFGLLTALVTILLYHEIINTQSLSSYYLILAGVFVIISVTSSAFAMQVLFFVFLGYSILYVSLIPLTFFLAPLLAGWFLPFTGVKEVLVHKLNHYIWYFRNRKGTSADLRNRFKDILYLPIRLFVAKNQAYDTIFVRNSFLIASYSCPIIFVVGYLLLPFSYEEVIYSEDDKWLVYTSIILVVSFLLTSWKPLRFLGEAERYFEYSLFFFVAILFSHPLLVNELSLSNILSLILLQVITVLFMFLYENKSYFRGARKERRFNLELLDFFKQDKSKRSVLTVPIKFSFFLAHRLKDHNNLDYYYMFVTDELDGFKYMEEDSNYYDYPISDFTYFQSKYGINTVVIINKHLKKYPDLKNWKHIYSNSEYSVFES